MSDSELGTPRTERPTTSTRDPEELRTRLEEWLGARLDAGAQPRVAGVRVPEKNGMSSETLLFDATWKTDDGERAELLVARVAPDLSSVPVFPTYDLEGQFATMRAVAEHSTVPVPTTFWFEPDSAYLGAPFFVMGRIEGEVPPDVMPYTFGDNWVFDATPEQRRALQDASVGVLAALHQIPDPTTTFAFLGPPAAGESALRRHVERLRAYHEWVVGDGPRSSLIDEAFAALEARWPASEGPTVLSWGDSRIGNIMYAGFAPVAVLDWEMADFAPPEVDIAWMIYLHRFFEDLAVGYGLPGLGNFMNRSEIAATYEQLTGYTPQDLDFYTLYTALRHAVVMFRVNQRSIHFGEAEMPDNPDEMFIHHATVREMVDGGYWDRVGR